MIIAAVTAGLIVTFLVGLVAVAGLWFVLAYNGLVALRNEARNAWAQIDVQLKRRHDLIPNLVEAVRGYMRHERETLEAVTRARSIAQHASGAADISKAEQGLSGALRQLFALAERYPDLKANQSFLALQEELASTENRIGFARQFYNDQVMQLNTRIQTIPTNLVAGMFGFAPMEFFQLSAAEEREAPQVLGTGD